MEGRAFMGSFEFAYLSDFVHPSPARGTFEMQVAIAPSRDEMALIGYKMAFLASKVTEL